MMHLPLCKPRTILELRHKIDDFASIIGEEQLRKMVGHTRERAEYCVQADGGHFEDLL